ncbi:putative signal peptide protein [Liberibacter crescens BT-1]|uniref:Putative signal peptide protein n=1 Tax=Liberibacter crescens (strain BT-1) TaxID=1215343 RepID=L0ES04_LIBCB|nr:invasion associated locus B family protein [Liberibacter crescens]AGA64279.1 putative signal peptide protein [Liberibacter crescens BT-1]
MINTTFIKKFFIIFVVFSVQCLLIVKDVAAADGGVPHTGWYKTCNKQENNDICIVQNVVVADGGQLVTAVGIIYVEGKVNKKLIQVSVPSARYTRSGITMRIDNGKAQKMDYLVCMPDKCMTEINLADSMLNSLKKGNEITLSSVNYRRVENPIKISLKGFAETYSRPPMSESELEDSQRKMQESMQKKADDVRKKLEDAQDAATKK